VLKAKLECALNSSRTERQNQERMSVSSSQVRRASNKGLRERGSGGNFVSGDPLGPRRPCLAYMGLMICCSTNQGRIRKREMGRGGLGGLRMLRLDMVCVVRVRGNRLSCFYGQCKTWPALRERASYLSFCFLRLRLCIRSL
jgi:hypothetical protein